MFRWVPIPLWCYAIPMIAVTAGWLPRESPLYPAITASGLPVALGLLLLGVDLPSVARAGWRVITVAAIGASGIVLGAPLGVWLLGDRLPAEAWKGAGALAGTWTGGTMNLLALRTILEPPDAVFAPLIAVDALIAYGWMALLVAASAHQSRINQWLRAPAEPAGPDTASTTQAAGPAREAHRWRAILLCTLLAVAVATLSQLLAPHLPRTRWVSSASAWSVLLVTTATLGLSMAPALRRLGAHGASAGYPLLYAVLAATGAQARLEALWSTPVWVVLGLMMVATHGVALLIAGRLLRVPLGLLATASQANIGGVVSAPMVGAVYHQSLAPVGLLLALAGNAMGTYVGLLAAGWCQGP